MDLAAQELVDGLIGSVVAPGGEVVVRRALLRQVVREIGPLASGSPLVEDRVHDVPHVIGALMAADRAVPVLPCGDHRLDSGSTARPIITIDPGKVSDAASDAADFVGDTADSVGDAAGSFKDGVVGLFD